MANSKYPRKPSWVLTVAFKMAMAITLALARDRATDKSRSLYFGDGARIKGMAEIWKQAKERYSETVKLGSPDASVLLRAEHNIRRNFSRILLKTSVKYGSIETKRVKREEGNKKYLNILWDYAGGILRDFVKSRFFFPRPVKYTKQNGKPGYCYRGSKKNPFYPVMHNHIPELDFGDMVRSPLMELARQCLKYGVPIKDAKKYIDALLLKLAPFLDYVYTSRRSGRSNYVRDGLKELRKVVNQIKREYGTRNGQRQSVTAEILESADSEIIPDDSIALENFVEVNYDEAGEESNIEPEKKKKTHLLEKVIALPEGEGEVLDENFQQLKNLLDNGTLTVEDSQALVAQAKEQSRRIGIRIHRFVARNFQSPFSLNGIIFHGKDMAYDDSGLILLSEVPVDGGRGKVDLLLARAKKLTKVDGAPSRIICEPFMVIDLKTKSAFNFDMYGIESRTKKSNNIVREFILERRVQTDEEWERILANTPRKEEKLQLDAYEKALLTDYQHVMRKDLNPQDTLVKAVLVVDSFQKWKDISKAILPLVLRAYDGCVKGTLSDGDYLVPTKDEKRVRIAMRMLSVTKPTTDTIELEIPIPQKPFQKPPEEESDEMKASVVKREFILYLTVPSKGSPAQSAAAIAERWHGLEYVYSLAKRRHRDVFLIDLVGEYRDPTLRKNQFKLRYQTEQIKRFFRSRVQVKDLSEQIASCIYEGKGIETFRKEIQDILENTRNPLVVVSGWESLRKSTPDSYSKYLDEVAATIIEAIPDKSTTLWFARPVPIAQNNTTYSTRCVAPFYQGDLWQNFVDTIIWNVAMPKSFNERGIFVERPGQLLERKLIKIEPLMNWGEDFRSRKHKDRVVYQKGTGLFSQGRSKHTQKQLDKAMELIPHLLEMNKYSQQPKSDSRLVINRVTSGYDISQDFEPLLAFRPDQIYSQIIVDDSGTQVAVDGPDTQSELDGRIKILLPLTTVDRKREYRPMELDVVPPKRNTRPPSEHYLSSCEFGELNMALTEIRKLRNTLKFLRLNDENQLKELLDRLSEVLVNITEEGVMDDVNTLFNKLRLIHTILATDELGKEVWKRMLPFRSSVPRNLTDVQREHITSIQKKHPDILMITGNHLFLLILKALAQTPAISFTKTLAVLWDYIRPWHLMGLGFRPVYPKRYNRGRSVLDRHKLLKRLEQLVTERNMALEQQPSLTGVRYGQLIGPCSGRNDKSNYLWLIFQRSSGVFDMNAALLNPRGVDQSMSLHNTINDMVSERTYWSESDIALLSRYAELKGKEFRMPVMLAYQQGIQVLWIADGEYDRWKPVGQIHYSTRRFEDVTLVRTITISKDPHLRPVEYENVRRPIHSVEDMVDRAFLFLNRGLEGCTHAKCKVTLNQKERMYRVVFTEQNTGMFLGELVINRTVDLLEVLRRPDNECEPILVNGRRLIWNRFRNISYDKDVALITPWVNRSSPFPGMTLKLPSTAGELIDARKEFDVTLELYHDPWTCPLRDISLEAIKKSKQQIQKFGDYHPFRYERHWAEPERISNEPGLHHGSCWRIHVDTHQTLTTGLKELKEVRFTDAQVRALLSPQELVYKIREKKEWGIHTFKVIVKERYIEEAKESWHLRKLLENLTGKEYGPGFPGVYRKNPEQWSPYIIIVPEYIVVGLIDKENRTVTEEKKIIERDVALRERSEVVELLEQEMRQLLDDKGITADRRMNAAIRTEIEDTMDDLGLFEDKAVVVFDGATIDEDSVGGRVVYVFLTSEHASHKIPITGHLHDIRSIRKDEFVDEVKSTLSDYNLSEEDLEKAVTRCLTIMRRKKLIKR